MRGRGDVGCAVDTRRLCFLVSRLEERESEMKKEYNALHQRHTEVGARPRPGSRARLLAFTSGFSCPSRKVVSHVLARLPFASVVFTAVGAQRAWKVPQLEDGRRAGVSGNDSHGSLLLHR